MAIRYWVVFALLATTVACGSRTTTKGSCVSGETQTCACAGGGDGQRTCNSSLEFDACECTDSCADDSECAAGEVCSSGFCEADAADSDGDGVANSVDNCPEVANPNQADEDGDGIGDECEVPGDGDGDGVGDGEDNCPAVANADQADLDRDGAGDACDDDRDGDGVSNGTDNCPNTRNPDQSDTNGDGIGDVCDGDFDGIVDELDNCPSEPNPGQADADSDGLGDACDLDNDGDGVLDAVDNCPADANTDQLDTDVDGLGDACDDDDDGDGILDGADNCPLIVNPQQVDRQSNGVGDLCDDPDGDGVVDSEDNCPDEANPDQAPIDADSDGLLDCEERALGTNPNLADSDGDGLSDLEEIAIYQSNPNLADTDSDGLNDGDEVGFGLDPTNPSTFNDGVLDGDRPWILGCTTQNPKATSTYTNTAGGWIHVVPTEVTQTVEVAITGADATNGYAATVFKTGNGDVSGFVARWNAPSVAATIAEPNLRYFVNHEGDDVVMSRSVVGSALTLDAMRDAKLASLVPWALADMTNLPAPAGFPVASARAYLSLTRGNGTITLAGAFTDAALPRLDLLEDLTNAMNVAPVGSTPQSACTPWAPRPSDPAIDLYWVLDQSGSMTDDFNRLKQTANSVFAALGNAHVDFRIGVVNMDRQIAGRVRNPPGWHTDITTFITEIDDFVIDCQGCGSTSGYEEWGIYAAEQGITWMRGATAPAALQIRPEAHVVTIFMTDEEEQTFQNSPLTTAAGRMALANYEAFFGMETTVFSLTGDAVGCGLSDGAGYRALAAVTGGMDISLCSVLASVFDEIAIEAAGAASPYRLPTTAISSSLRVEVSGVEVPRNRNYGYEYFPAFGTIAFFGSSRPTANAPVLVHYQTF